MSKLLIKSYLLVLLCGAAACWADSEPEGFFYPYNMYSKSYRLGATVGSVDFSSDASMQKQHQSVLVYGDIALNYKNYVRRGLFWLRLGGASLGSESSRICNPQDNSDCVSWRRSAQMLFIGPAMSVDFFRSRMQFTITGGPAWVSYKTSAGDNTGSNSFLQLSLALPVYAGTSLEASWFSSAMTELNDSASDFSMTSVGINYAF
ncbi:hypothetical protein [Oceanobacter mangrovi]|uniref:hypothetical protein n=1 Tax=Oceanobacter mangrovi TaxID=2862510 RepID=UPI001C8E28DB|nr:hypothetical protein [Oceanobacter mangrovi]